MKDNSLLERIAEEISDGNPVDWESDETASNEMRPRLRGLQLVESVAALHRSLSDEVPDLTATADAAKPAAAGTVWGPLVLVKMLGEGGFGAVWHAREENLDRDVALKLRKKRGGADDPFAGKFLDEARRLAKVEHENVVKVYGADEHDGREGLWTELVRGKTLEDELKERGRFGDREAALVGVDLCRALAAVHNTGLVHRDVKTANAMRAAGGKLLLMDFGSVTDIPKGGERTQGEGITGTPLAMAPEALRGAPPDTAADIYSLGVLLYRLVTAAHPVEAQSYTELYEKHERGEMIHLRDRRADLSRDFVQVVERALAKDPAERYRTAGAMESALSKALGAPQDDRSVRDERPAPPEPVVPPTPDPIPAPAVSRPPVPMWGWAAMAAGVVVVAGLAITQPWKTEPDSGVVGDRAQPRQTAAPETTAPTTPTPAESAPAAAVPFVVEASLFREGPGTVPVALGPGSTVRPNDGLFIELKSSKEAYTYIFNEDQQGERFLLFPLPDVELQNPLPAGVRHRLPGTMDGESVNWEVTSYGGKEKFVVIASPEPLAGIEQEMAKFARAGLDGPVPPEVGETVAKILTRGVGRMKKSKSGSLSTVVSLSGAGDEIAVHEWTVDNPPPGS